MSALGPSRPAKSEPCASTVWVMSPIPVTVVSLVDGEGGFAASSTSDVSPICRVSPGSRRRRPTPLISSPLSRVPRLLLRSSIQYRAPSCEIVA